MFKQPVIYDGQLQFCLACVAGGIVGFFKCPTASGEAASGLPKPLAAAPLVVADVGHLKTQQYRQLRRLSSVWLQLRRKSDGIETNRDEL